MKWEKKKLEDVCISITDGDHQSIPTCDKGIPFILIPNLKGSYISFDNVRYVSKEYYDKLDYKRKPSTGDVLLSVKGSFGIPSYVKTNYPFTFQRDIAIFKCRPDFNSKFLYYYFKSSCFYKYADSIAIGAAQRALTLKMLKGIEICVPPINIQNKIVNILSAYDDLIENNQKQIKLLEEAAQRLYKEWFVDLRFPGHENVKIIDNIPEKWCTNSILDNKLFIFVKSKVLAFDGEKKYYATADVTDTTLTGVGESITFYNKPSRATIQPMANTVWFARMSNSYKILNCYGESSHLAEDSIISSGFAGFSSIEGCYGFVYETIASKKFDEEKNRYATGATQISLTNEGLKKIQILIPTIEIAKQYSIIVEPMIKKSELLKKNCKLLQQSRDRLLPKLINGEIEV